MVGHPPPDSGQQGSPRELGEKILRYAAGSALATVCSEAAFLLAYGALQATPAVASGVGWLAGAVPNYWLNRTWTWGRRGRPSVTREVLPYVVIVVGSLVLAAVATSLVDAALAGAQLSAVVRVVLVGGTFLSVYGVVFCVRFFLLDQLFGRAGPGSSPGAVAAPPAGETVAEEPV